LEAQRLGLEAHASDLNPRSCGARCGFCSKAPPLRATLTDFGHADQLSRSTNTSVDGLVRGGVFWARAGRARLLAPDDLSDGWNPLTDERISLWEAVVRLAKTLDQQGGEEAAQLMGAVAQRVDLDAAKEMAYLLFSICEKKKWTETALLFNGLGTSWSDLSAVARAGGSRTPPPAQPALEFATGDQG